MIKLSAPVHLPFDQLELGDLSFHLAIRPWLRDCRVRRALIFGEAFANEAMKLCLDSLQFTGAAIDHLVVLSPLARE